MQKVEYLCLYFNLGGEQCRIFEDNHLLRLHHHFLTRSIPSLMLFVCLETDEVSYSTKMNSCNKKWLWKLAWNEKKSRQELSSRYSVESVPALVVLRKEYDSWKLISTVGAEKLIEDPNSITNFPWIPMKVELLSPSSMSILHSKTCLLLFFLDEVPAILKIIFEIEKLLTSLISTNSKKIHIFWIPQKPQHEYFVTGLTKILQIYQRPAAVILDMPRNRVNRQFPSVLELGNIQCYLNSYFCSELNFDSLERITE